MEKFIEKLHRELIFTDLLMIGFNLLWLIAIFFQMIGTIPSEYSGALWGVHFCFGIPSITWYLGLRARWKYTPEELRDIVAFHTSGCNCHHSTMNSSYNSHDES